MMDTTVKTSELSSRSVLVTTDTQFIILDKGITDQSPSGSTMTTPASAVIALVANFYNLKSLANLFTGFSTQSANNLDMYSSVSTTSATWNNKSDKLSVSSISYSSNLLFPGISDKFYKVNLLGNVTINRPTSGTDGSSIVLWMYAPSATNVMLVLDPTIKVPSTSIYNVSASVLSGTKTKLFMEYDAQKVQWELTSIIGGY